MVVEPAVVASRIDDGDSRPGVRLVDACQAPAWKQLASQPSKQSHDDEFLGPTDPVGNTLLDPQRSGKVKENRFLVQLSRKAWAGSL
jgi:hypothetical protein